MRIDYGPGYRVYFTCRTAVIVLLVCGGDKSTQRKDVERAKSWLASSKAKGMARKQTKTTWKQFDAADYIKSERDVALYLDAVMEEAADNPALLAHALGDVARARGNMSQLARHAGVTREGLYKALSPRGNPSFVTVARIARALDLEIHFRPLKTPSKDREKGPRLAGPERPRTSGHRSGSARIKSEMAPDAAT